MSQSWTAVSNPVSFPFGSERPGHSRLAAEQVICLYETHRDRRSTSYGSRGCRFEFCRARHIYAAQRAVRVKDPGRPSHFTSHSPPQGPLARATPSWARARAARQAPFPARFVSSRHHRPVCPALTRAGSAQLAPALAAVGSGGTDLAPGTSAPVRTSETSEP